MSLTPKISISEETKNSFIVYECTGKYNGTNKGGWTTPNVNIDTVETAVLEICALDNPVPYIVDVFPDFPRTDGVGYEIMPFMIGQGTEIESGKYKVKIIYTGTDKSGEPYKYTGETTEILIKAAECCVDKVQSKNANVPLTVFMKDDKKKKAIELSNLLEDARWAKDCNLYDKAQEILKFIQLQCVCCS